MEIEQKLNAAAWLLKCRVDEFMAYAERPNGDLVVIAATGQKFVYSTDRLAGVLQAVEPAIQKKPVEPAPAGPETAGSDPSQGQTPPVPAKKTPERSKPAVKTISPQSKKQ